MAGRLKGARFSGSMSGAVCCSSISEKKLPTDLFPLPSLITKRPFGNMATPSSNRTKLISPVLPDPPELRHARMAKSECQ